MSLTPTTPATFYDFKDEVISVPLVTLAAWCAAFKCVVEKDFDPTGRDVTKVIYKALSAPESYSKRAMLDHLLEVKRQTHEFYGIED